MIMMNIKDRQASMMRFASLHDWGHDARANPDGSVTVGCEVGRPDGTWFREFTRVTSMDELRMWAGY